MSASRASPLVKAKIGEPERCELERADLRFLKLGSEPRRGRSLQRYALSVLKVPRRECRFMAG